MILRLAVLVDVMHPLVDRFMARWVAAAASGHIVGEIDQIIVVSGGFKENCTRAVAEDHAGSAVLMTLVRTWHFLSPSSSGAGPSRRTRQGIGLSAALRCSARDGVS